ncbi:MAG: PQQ-binding-like beta-propeller repeat protein [Bacteroidales bacterium]|nr:PQQ-binding-like beta-propeller repeat protein [Bacteroidales bacterium]
MKKMPLLIATFSLSLIVSCQNQATIYEWRGPDRTGIYPDKGLLTEWPEEGPAELWSTDNLGNGYGSPVFAENEFFITGETDSVTYLFCFDIGGTQKWKTRLGGEWMRSYPGGRDAPTVAGNLVYVGTGLGNLYCVNRKDGKIVWSKELKADFDGLLPLHGYSEAPLLDGDRVFWTPGGKENNVVALNRFTGEIMWSHPGYGEAQGYNQAKLIKLAERNLLVTFSSWHLMGFDAATGDLLWSHEQDNLTPDRRKPGYGDTHCNTVIYEPGFIWYVAGDGNCGVKLSLSADGTAISEIWRNKGFDSYMGGIVKLGDYLYGGCNAKPELRSINAITGETVDSLRTGPGAVISAEGLLYYYSQRGEMMLLKSVNGKFEKISSFRITKGTREHFSHPVINKGILYQRHGNSLMAYDIRKK